MASGPTIKRGKSKQDVETPPEFIAAVVPKFGKIAVDLAATKANTKAPTFIGPETDSLTVRWHRLVGLCWLNPPYANIAPWAQKCAVESTKGAEILFLVPASVGSNWFWDWVWEWSDVYSVGRMVFANCYDKKGNLITTPYPKDLILCHYPGVTKQSFQRWRWNKKEEVRHGFDCKKAPHIGTGHLHGEKDDTAYDVDGVLYCGRCHKCLP